MEKIKSKFVIVGVVILLILGLFVLKSLKKTNNKSPESLQDYLEQVQKGNIPGLSSSKNDKEKVNIVGSIKVGEEKEINFMMHDYSTIDKNLHDLAAQKKQRKPLKGKLKIRIKKIGAVDKINPIYDSQSKKEYKYYYVVYEIKGFASNPQGVYIHPQSASETGWDPAPQFVVYKDNKTKYPTSIYRRSILRTLGYDDPLSTPNFNKEEWQIMAAGWKLKYKPTILFKYITPDGKENYLRVKE